MRKQLALSFSTIIISVITVFIYVIIAIITFVVLS